MQKNRKNKKLIFLSIALLALLITSTIALFPSTTAKTYNGTIQTFAFLTAAPNPIGVGQQLFLSMWVDKVPNTATGVGGDRWQGLKIAVIKPDGTTETLGPFTADAAGGAPDLYTPTMTGNYTFTLSFPGQTLTGDNGTGTMTTATQFIGDVYGPSTSKPVTVLVKEEPIPASSDNSLPTDYWQRPIESFNNQWWTIGGNWLGLATIDFGFTGVNNVNGDVNPYSQAVLSPHVIWTKPVYAGGQLGGPFTGNSSSNYYTGSQYQPKFAPVILNGVLYYNQFADSMASNTGITAVDIRTGKTLWTVNTTDLLICGQILDPVSYNQFGGVAYIWAQTGGSRWVTSANNDLHMYDAVTGTLITTIKTQSIGTKLVDGYGGIISYSLLANSNNSYTFRVWNSTLAVLTSMPVYLTGAIVTGGSWAPPAGSVVNFTSGYQNISVIDRAWNGANLTLSLSAYDLENQIIIATASGNTVGSSLAVQLGYQIEAGISMTTGKVLWVQNRTHTPFTEINYGPAGNGVYTQYERQTISWTAYSTKTGEKLWTTDPQGNSLDYYGWRNHGMMAYGNFYDWTYGGEVYAYNLTTGKTEWSWSTGSTGFDNPYGVNVLWPFGPGEATIAGGIVYVASGHNYGPPLYKNAKIYAINATTGESIWDFLNYATMSSLPVADGYMLSLNNYDLQIYAYGKGLTQTTVSTAPGMNSKNQVLITGAVTDQSPGQTCLGIPAAGTPAVSDASMSQWMAYLYEQSPKPTNATGVTITLSYVDPNNNTGIIGTAVSDISGQYSYAYTPPVPGTYKIIAAFGGSESYFSSTAQTAMLFNEPAATTAPTAAPQQSVADQYFVPAIAGLFVLIIIVLVLVVFSMLRKRP